MRMLMMVLCLALLFGTGCTGDTDGGSSSSTDAAVEQDAGDALGGPDTSEPAHDCDACTTAECYRACDAPALSPPDTAPTCTEVLRFEEEFERLYHLRPSDYTNLFNIDGECGAANDTPDFAFTFVAPTDGEFIVVVENLSTPGDNTHVLHIDTVSSPASICEDLGSNALCAQLLDGDRHAFAAREVQAGDEIVYILELPEAADFAISGAYYEEPAAPGESCEEASDCGVLADCQQDVCTCVGGSQEAGGMCQCPSGTSPNDDYTACEDGPVHPCDADPYPCADDETCSLDDTGGVVCEPEGPALAKVGEPCRDVSCEAGLRCETTTVCPADTLKPICVTPCTSDSQCNESNIACSKTSSLASPSCDPVNSISDRTFCNWD